MSTTNSIRAKIYAEVSKDNLKDAIGLALHSISKENEFYDYFVLLSKRYSKNFKSYLKKTIIDDAFETEENQIAESILDTIKMIAPTEFADSGYKPNRIPNPILVFCPNQERKAYIANLFKLLGYDGTNVVLVGEVLPPKIGANYDLVVFDNTDLGRLPSTNPKKSDTLKLRLDLMKRMIDDEGQFIIHLGDTLNWIFDHRESVHPANSKFALHARITEMLDFLKSI